jgi:hypothetical protein
MKIDNLITLLKPHTLETVLIIDKKTIDSFFDDIEIHEDYIATFDVETLLDARSIYRNGVTIHFLESGYISTLEEKHN